MILPFLDDKCVLELLLENFKKSDINIPIIIVTTKKAEDDPIVVIARKANVLIFRGYVNDVLKRFIDASEKYQVNYIVRVCADNPFFDVDGTMKLLDKFLSKPCDYLGYKLSDNLPSIKSHLGFWGEIVTLDTLKKVYKLTNKKIYREHVTNFIYENPLLFDINFIKAPDFIFNRKDIRLTLDTYKDFKIDQEIYRKLIKISSDFKIRDIIDFLDKNNYYFK